MDFFIQFFEPDSVENARITKSPIRSEPILHSEIGFQNQNQ